MWSSHVHNLFVLSRQNVTLLSLLCNLVDYLFFATNFVAAVIYSCTVWCNFVNVLTIINARISIACICVRVHNTLFYFVHLNFCLRSLRTIAGISWNSTGPIPTRTSSQGRSQRGAYRRPRSKNVKKNKMLNKLEMSEIICNNSYWNFLC